MKKKIIVIFGAILLLVVVAAIVVVSFVSTCPRLQDCAYRLQPAIIEKPSVKALVVEATGDPNTTVGPAFGLLMSTYFKIKEAPKGKNMEAPRARWPKPLESPKNEWLGIYSIPVPQSVTVLPSISNKSGLSITLTDWQYGTVAEILHTGSYGSEDTSVAKLKKFIAEKGYEIVGPHEEEYLKGPSFFPRNPKDYLTIIRYQVKKSSPN